MAQQFSAADFEKLVAQIIRVLSETSAQVSRDTRISDPDTGGSRQIDVLVDNRGYKTHYECRHHVKPQDVKWIEELMGRRLSLRADAMAAVSSSGFTRPAITKAMEYKIGLLDMREFLPESIASLPSIYFKYLQLENLKVHLGFSKSVGSHDAFSWFAHLGFSSYEGFELFVNGLRAVTEIHEQKPFWVPVEYARSKIALNIKNYLWPKRFHISGSAIQIEKTVSPILSMQMQDKLVSKWLGDVHSFGPDGCHFIKTLDVENFMVDFVLLHLPIGSALTEIAFTGGGVGMVNVSGNIRDLRKPPQEFSVEVSIESSGETEVHNAFQKIVRRHTNLSLVGVRG